MYNQLQKVINLVNKTGDRVIVVDSANPENIFVVMGLDEYEKIVGYTETKQIWQSKIRDLTEDELLDRINRDIAIWKSENDLAKYPPANSVSLGEAEENEENKELPPTTKRWDYDIDFPAQDWFAAEREDSNIDDDVYYYEDQEDLFIDYPQKEIIGQDNHKKDFKDIGKSGNYWEIPSGIKEGAEEAEGEDEVESF